MHRQKYSGVMLIDLIWMQKVRSQTCRNIKYIKRAFNFCIVILFLFISVNMHCIYHSFCLHRFPLLVSLSGEELSKSCHSNSALKYLLLPLPLLYLSKLWFQKRGWKTICAQSSNLRCLWNYISAPAAQGSNPARTYSPGYCLLLFERKCAGNTVGFIYLFILSLY